MHTVTYVIHKPHGNHKGKTYSKYTKDTEKGIKAYHYQNIIQSQRKTIREKEGTIKVRKQLTKWH